MPFLYVHACACPACLRCAECSASLGPLVFHGSRRELLATVVTFVGLASFFLLCHISYLVGCVRKFCWWIFGFGFVTSSKAFHNGVWLLVMLYKFFRWSLASSHDLWHSLLLRERGAKHFLA